MLISNGKIEVNKEIILQYYDNLISGFYKALSLYENVDFKTKEIKCTPEESYEQYQIYLNNFGIELVGCYYILSDNFYFIKIMNIVEGMKDIGLNKHKQLKSLVFNCISVCEKMKEDVMKDDT